MSIQSNLPRLPTDGPSAAGRQTATTTPTHPSVQGKTVGGSSGHDLSPRQKQVDGNARPRTPLPIKEDSPDEAAGAKIIGTENQVAATAREKLDVLAFIRSSVTRPGTSVPFEKRQSIIFQCTAEELKLNKASTVAVDLPAKIPAQRKVEGSAPPLMSAQIVKGSLESTSTQVPQEVSKLMIETLRHVTDAANELASKKSNIYGTRAYESAVSALEVINEDLHKNLMDPEVLGAIKSQSVIERMEILAPKFHHLAKDVQIDFLIRLTSEDRASFACQSRIVMEVLKNAAHLPGNVIRPLVDMALVALEKSPGYMQGLDSILRIATPEQRTRAFILVDGFRVGNKDTVRVIESMASAPEFLTNTQVERLTQKRIDLEKEAKTDAEVRINSSFEEIIGVERDEDAENEVSPIIESDNFASEIKFLTPAQRKELVSKMLNFVDEFCQLAGTEALFKNFNHLDDEDRQSLIGHLVGVDKYDEDFLSCALLAAVKSGALEHFSAKDKSRFVKNILNSRNDRFGYLATAATGTDIELFSPTEQQSLINKLAQPVKFNYECFRVAAFSEMGKGFNHFKPQQQKEYLEAARDFSNPAKYCLALSNVIPSLRQASSAASGEASRSDTASPITKAARASFPVHLFAPGG